MSDYTVAGIDLKQLLEAGVHFGHQAQRWNPRMKPYLYTVRDGVHIFDLVKTAEQLEKAMKFANSLGKQGKTLVFVGTKRQAQETIANVAKEAGAMYITTRWLGGLITNWEQVSKSIAKMNKLRVDLAGEEYAHLTKYERGQLQKELDRLERFFGGVADLKTAPDALFVVDANEENVAIKEARAANIPVLGLVDSNVNPEKVDYPIPGNDDAVTSVELLTKFVADAYAAGRKGGAKKE